MDETLYQELLKFNIGDSKANLTFAKRLARENGWTEDYADKVILEYKRFLYLAMKAGHTVTPSDDVDQAWHLHLSYSKSYWKDLCEGVLKQPLHHEPTQGGSKETKKYVEQYQKTLESYAEAFGEKPPSKIWPPVEKRFKGQRKFVRTSRETNYIFPKFVIQVPLVILGFLLLAKGIKVLLRQREFLEKHGTLLLYSIFIGTFIILLIYSIIKYRKGENRGNDSGCGPGCGDSGCGDGCGGGCGGCGD